MILGMANIKANKSLNSHFRPSRMRWFCAATTKIRAYVLMAEPGSEFPEKEGGHNDQGG